ncbi:alpha/beta-type small acid-soluble spore protein [Asaccharospora irregularis]|uniref:Small, acid-soluble spore protein, alpha/beta type n=1 Tax=Asaccharospora irregularis DSM 2635 TaxID=1121321 RepID=A0A1M5RYL7_9FIRM|nr:alpha/beta-type small acid-soluble spore protein [Asaccharospora irregularis]SHH31300.1 Small, acid-soluble spore protein, alpha/beta type [Asaccharospora irregularis DSM 2635]
MTNSNSNKTVVPEAKAALNQMKLEIANEIGLANYDSVDKGNLTARQNGYVGGYMTKKLVEMAERQMAGK